MFGTRWARFWREWSGSAGACEARLIDPDDPDKFTLDAHDDEVMIIWRDLRDRDETGKPIRKRSTLREPIAQC